MRREAVYLLHGLFLDAGGRHDVIVRMAKVEIVGPQGRVEDVLTLLQKMEVLQIETEGEAPVEGGAGAEKIRPFLHDDRERALFEKLFLDDLRRKITGLFTFFPAIPVRTSSIEPQAIVGTILSTVEKHLSEVKELHGRKADLERAAAEARRFARFLETVDSLYKETHAPPHFDIIGLTIKDPSAVDHLRAQLTKLTDGNFRLFTVPAGDGTLAGMITIEKSVAENVSAALTREQVPEMTFPKSFAELSISGKIAALETQALQAQAEIESIDRQLAELCRRWMPLYRRVLEWIDERVSVLRVTASVYRTQMCFSLHGWMPANDVAKLRAQLDASFGMEVVLEEKHVREQEIEHAPIVLANPPYFKPFELFSRMLPLPAYGSLDPTPYIGIFFPVFFGMILGDAGYGVILLILSIIVRRRFSRNKTATDGASILLASSLYTIIFGMLYGEVFGDLGERLFGLKPLLIERRTSVVPMMVFAVSAGVVHILLGLGLGAVTAFRKRARREAAYKLLNILVIIGMVVVLASFFGFFPATLSRSVIIAVLIATPFLFFTGGLLAPLELLKSIGNIISYVRIMAIGLTSVLLAYVANRLAGEMGDIVIGVAMATLLHLLNLILGVFSPTIHALRLHYVEFFSKFVESGGKKFEPLGKKEEGHGLHHVR